MSIKQTPHKENAMHTRAVNIRTEQYDIYCGRPRQGQQWGFGNPFRVGRDGQRGECVGMFERWFDTGDAQGCVDATPQRREWMQNNLLTLIGKRLGCFCKPSACHCDILADRAMQLNQANNR